MAISVAPIGTAYGVFASHLPPPFCVVGLPISMILACLHYYYTINYLNVKSATPIRMDAGIRATGIKILQWRGKVNLLILNAKQRRSLVG